MLKNIRVIPRSQMEFIIDNDIFCDFRWAVISIYSTPAEILITENKWLKLNKLGCRIFLNLCFADIEVPLPDEPKYKDLKLFDNKDAKKIVEFLDIISKFCEVLVVHCDAGISRSGAVGLFACKYLNLDEKKFMEKNRIYPNNHIYRTLMETSGMTAEFIQQFEDNPKYKEK